MVTAAALLDFPPPADDESDAASAAAARAPSDCDAGPGAGEQAAPKINPDFDLRRMMRAMDERQIGPLV